MATPESTPKRGYDRKTLSVQPKFHKSYTKAVNATQTFAELIGEPLPDNVYAVSVYLQDDNILYYQNGAAAATDGGMQRYDRIPFVGTKDELDLIELFTGDATDNNVTIDVYTL
jgi:hypothetical protein